MNDTHATELVKPFTTDRGSSPTTTEDAKKIPPFIPGTSVDSYDTPEEIANRAPLTDTQKELLDMEPKPISTEPPSTDYGKSKMSPTELSSFPLTDLPGAEKRFPHGSIVATPESDTLVANERIQQATERLDLLRAAYGDGDPLAQPRSAPKPSLYVDPANT